MRTLFVLCLAWLCAFSLEFSIVHKGQSLDDDNTLLILGGIQGDEPGGFHAASLIISDYNITKGKLIVVPNLAFDSIIKRSRGLRGDLNRKFAELSKSDPDYATIQRIKELILLPEVTMVLNLHDGWGFYRPEYINAEQNPKRWGNSSVIDSTEINATKYYELEKIAQSTIENVNASLLDQKHEYHIKNTRTKELEDSAMLKALTYFVISNNKAAFANEASKNLPVNVRVYYHLLAIENYLKTAGIEFERKFELSPKGVQEAIDKERIISLFKQKFLLELKNPPKSLNHIPFPINESLDYTPNNELTAILAEPNSFYVQYGNRFQTRLYPEYFEFSSPFHSFKLIVDGEEKNTQFAQKITVKKDFLIPKIEGVRVNIIGFNKGGDESNILVSKNNFQKQYSLDTNKALYRVEFYELRKANLEQNNTQKAGEKLIKNPSKLSEKSLQSIKEKDKFIGSILVEFE